MGGYIMQLQHFSVNDGDGIRTIVFMAGCPLRCAWCANPEGQTCDNALTRWIETEDVLQEIRRQSIFFHFSGGGVTFSGGEATAQPTFLRELVDALYDEGYSLAIETCGYFNFADIEPILHKMDTIFMDLKHIDPAQHHAYTGVDNTLILENIRQTAAQDMPLVVRIPAILTVNCDDATLNGMFAFLRDEAPSAKLEFLPYHRYGESKYSSLGLPLPAATFATPSDELLAAWQRRAEEDYGLQVVSYK